MPNRVDLASLFQAVTQTLYENQAQLNEADNYNHNHGDNMVDAFSIITKAIEEKPHATPEKQLLAASRALEKNGTSGSAKMFAQTLADASKTVDRNGVTLENAMPFLQTLLGGTTLTNQETPPQQPAPSYTQQPTGSDTLSTLLAGMNNAQNLPQHGSQSTPSQSGGGDLLSTLLGGMSGVSEAQDQPQEVSGNDLLSTLLSGMASGGVPQQQAPQQDAGGDLLSTPLSGMASGGAPQQQQAQPSGDLLSTLLSGMMSAGGEGGSSAQSQQPDIPGSLIGSLFSGLEGGNTQYAQNKPRPNNGIDMMSLIGMGLSYMQAKKQGKSTIEALVSSVLNNSMAGKQGYRKDSGSLIANTVLQMLSGAGAR